MEDGFLRRGNFDIGVKVTPWVSMLPHVTCQCFPNCVCSFWLSDKKKPDTMLDKKDEEGNLALAIKDDDETTLLGQLLDIACQPSVLVQLAETCNDITPPA